MGYLYQTERGVTKDIIAPFPQSLIDYLCRIEFYEYYKQLELDRAEAKPEKDK